MIERRLFFCLEAVLFYTKVVDFRCRGSLSAGRALSLLIAIALAGSQLSRYSRRTELASSNPHRTKEMRSIYEESSPFRSNQLVRDKMSRFYFIQPVVWIKTSKSAARSFNEMTLCYRQSLVC